MVRDKFCFSRTRWMSYGFILCRDECETKAKELMKKIKSWRYYEDDLEDEDGN